MMASFDRQEAEVLREILQSSLNQLRIESARADSSGFRASLHERERIVEGLLDKLAEIAVS